MTGQTISHYRIMEKIGVGGMGIVYRAHDSQLDRDVALKVLPSEKLSDETARARLVREARMASKLNHPHICSIYEVGEADGCAFIAMELVEGEPLSARLTHGALALEQAVRFGGQMADALAHAHDCGIVHRDLKTANVVITPKDCAKVLDFGLARRLNNELQLDETTVTQDSLTGLGVLAGTPAYMAPEQLLGRPADARSDIWALGVVLYEMAAGARPFQGSTGTELSSAILKDAPQPMPHEVPAELRKVIERCLEKEPGRRYQRASEVCAALEVVRPGIGTRPVAPYSYRRRWLVAPPLAAILLIGMWLAFEAGGWRPRLAGGTAGQVESVAVLPLENLSHSADQDYVADGIQDALITDLSRLGGFKKVIARTSVSRYRNSDKSPSKIAEELGVEAIVIGSVMRVGDKIRVTARLIRAKTEENLWAERYERQFRDVLVLQNEIVSAIAEGIKSRITPEQKAQLSTRRPVNPEAYEAYLKGMFQLNKLTPESIDKGLANLQLAIHQDPASALPYAGLALGYSMIGHTPNGDPAALTNAKTAALKALELDPTLAEAQEALAEVKAYRETDWDWPALEQMYKRALELNPSLPQAHAHYGWYLGLFGRAVEALAEVKRAAELDPLNPLYASWVTEQYTFGISPDPTPAGLAVALEQARKTLELNPDSPLSMEDIGMVYLTKGMYQESIPYFLKARKLNPDFGWELGMAYASLKQIENAHRLIAELQGPGLSWNRWGIAHIYAALGEKDKTFEWLEKAYQFRHPYIPWMRVSAPLQPLKSDPRFQEMVHRIKLPL